MRTLIGVTMVLRLPFSYPYECETCSKKQRGAVESVQSQREAVREVGEAGVGGEAGTPPASWRLEKGSILEVLDVCSGAKC